MQWRRAALDSLGEDAWFAGLSERLRDRVAAALVGREVPRGDAVYHQGDPSDGLYWIVSGIVTIERWLEPGDAALIYVGGPGFWIGPLAPLVGGAREISVVARRDCRLLLWPQRDIDAVMAQDLEAVRALAALVGRQMRALLDLHTEKLLLDARTLVARRLLVLARAGYGVQSPSGGSVLLRQADVAGMLGLTRKTINAVLGQLAVEGAVRVARGEIAIADLTMLGSIAARRRHP